jgi:RHS repeat-associated protein
LAEYADLEGSPSARYIYAGSQRIAMIDSAGAVYYYLNDHLGSAAVVINSSGTVRDKHKYQAFGGSDGASVGKPLDEELDLDWYYYGARYYDPSIGRFPSMDPLHGKYPGWSPYAYCLNNPVRNVDPDGDTVVVMSGHKNSEYNEVWVEMALAGDFGTSTQADVQTMHSSEVVFRLYAGDLPGKTLGRTVANFNAATDEVEGDVKITIDVEKHLTDQRSSEDDIAGTIAHEVIGHGKGALEGSKKSRSEHNANTKQARFNTAARKHFKEYRNRVHQLIEKRAHEHELNRVDKVPRHMMRLN